MLDSKQSALLSQEAQTWSPLHRECYVALTGAEQGIAHSLHDAITTDRQATKVKLVVSAGLGAAFSGLSARSGWGELAVAAATGSFLYAAAKDAYSRAIPTWNAIQDAGSTAANLDRDRTIVAATVGPFAVDWAITAAGGEFGGSLVHGARYVGTHASAEQGGILEQCMSNEAGGSKGAELSPAAPEASVGQIARRFMSQENFQDVSPASWPIYDNTVPSMYKLTAYRDNGNFSSSAFITGERGEAVTSFHSIAHANRVHLVDNQGFSYEARVTAVDAAHELAKVEPMPRYGEKLNTLQPIKLAASSKLAQGERVIAMGYADGTQPGQPRISEGAFDRRKFPTQSNGPNDVSDSERILSSKLQISPGYSGGPLLKEDGTVIGINYSRTEYTRTTNTVPVETIRRFIAGDKLEKANYFPLQNRIARGQLDTDEQSEIYGIYDRARNSVFQLKSRAADGSVKLSTAFAIDDNHLLTSDMALHADGSMLWLNRNGVWQDRVMIEHSDPGLGVAVLSREPQPGNAIAQIPLEFTERATTPQQQDLLALGFAENKAQMTVAQLDEPLGIRLADGFEGAPVIDRTGNVVGMARIFDAKTGEIRIVRPSGLKKALQQAGIGAIKRTL